MVAAMFIPKFHNFATAHLEKCVLRNCPVVIDAQSFFFDFYYESRLNDLFGCESNGFYSYVKKKLHIFKKCNVKCYFVFKGGDNDITKKVSKLKTVSINMDQHLVTRTNVFPIFASEIVKQVLQECNIIYSTCLTDTINECVAIAEQLDCAVIGKNTAFCFRNVPYIPKFTWDYNQTKDGIICHKFTLENFLNKHSLTYEKLAMFAIISDLNLYPKEVFQPLLQEWGVLNDDLIVQYINFTKWLARHTETEILNELSEALSNEDYATFLDAYFNKVAYIRNSDGGVVTNYLYNNGSVAVNSDDPDWFEKGVASNIIPTAYINLFKWRIIQGSTAIETKTDNDSILLAKDIFIYAYNLLTDFKGEDIKVYHNADDYTTLRTKDTITKPYYNCKESVFENGWQYNKHHQLFDHFLTENRININTVYRYRNLEGLLLISLVYFARKKTQEGIDVTDYIYCIIICFMMLQGTFFKRVYNFNERDISEAKYVTDKYFKLNDEEAKQIYDGDVLKTLVEFQYILLHLQYLNILCGSPYGEIWYFRAYNGTFVYKLLLDMRQSDPVLFIAKLFEHAPSVLAGIKQLITVYEDIFNDL